MPNTLTIRLTTNPTPAQAAGLAAEYRGGGANQVLSALSQLLDRVRSGAYLGSGVNALELHVGSNLSVRAAQTFTYSKVATVGKVATINGQSFTCAAVPVADEFAAGATVSNTACNLADSINASTTAGIVGIVFATALGQAASATAKCTTCIATDSLQVGPVTFTARAGIATYVYVSDSAANVLVGASDIAMSNNFAWAINSHPITSKLVHAVPDGADTVTITALAIGAAGNTIPLAQTGGTITLSAATLANGRDSVGATNGALGAAGVCTVYAIQPGVLANAITTVTDDANCVAGGGTMAAGAGEDALPLTWSF
jgi:hypothetical protein